MARRTIPTARAALRQGRGLLWLAFGLSCAVNLLRLAGPLFMILIYDRVLPARSEETLVALFGMVSLLLVALAVLDYGRRRILARFGARFQERLEVALFARSRHRDLFSDDRAKPVAGLDEVDGLRGFFHSASLIALFDFVWAPMFLFVVFVLNPLLGWVCLGGMAVILGLMLVRMAFGGARAADNDMAVRAVADLRTVLAQSHRTIRTQAMAGGFKHRWLTVRQTARDSAIAHKDWTVWFDSLCDGVVQLTRYGVLAMGAWLTLEGQLTIGAMVAATFLVTRVLGPVERFLTELPAITEARRSWTRVAAVVSADTADPVPDAPGNPRARLSLADLAVRRPGNGAVILRSVTLDVAPGQMVQITGASGRGKTVLAETVLGHWRRAGGAVLINGQNLTQLPDDQSDRILGYVPEQPAFVPGTLADNIAHMEPEPDPARVAQAARRACLHAVISALPDGYQTRIDMTASLLSRGQRSQLALARALYHAPQLLIIDEPDPALMDLIPRTMDRTFDQLLLAGTSVLVLARKPLGWKWISAHYQLDQGRLKPVPAGANSPRPVPAQVPKTGGAVTKLVR